MSILDLNLKGPDAAEPEVVEEGEYLVRLVSAEILTSQKGNEYVNAVLDLPDHPNAKDIYHVMNLPDGRDDRIDKFRLRSLRRFCEAFGIELDPPIDLEQGYGNTAYAILTIEESEEYGDRNRIRRFVESS